jgi:ELWxxDGT repeat protein
MRLRSNALMAAGLMLAQSVHGAELPGFQLGMVADLAPPRPMGQGSLAQNFRTIGNKVYFQATTPLTGSELFRTDGTAAGLELAADLAPGSKGSSPYVFGAAGHRAIVLADDGAGPQYWSVSAGEPSLRLTSMNWMEPPIPGAGRVIAQTENRLLWLNVGLSGIRSLWSSDGTVAGTGRVVGPSGFPTAPMQGCGLASRAVVAGEITGGMMLGAADGLAGEVLAQVSGAAVPAASSYTPDAFRVSFDSACYFLWERQGGGWTLWRSDGTTAGTYAFTSSADGQPAGVQVLHGEFFLLDRIGTQLRLLRSSVAQPAPVLVTSDLSSHPTERPSLTQAGDYLLFLAYPPGSSERKLYRSDGTAAGTQSLLAANVQVGDALLPLQDAAMAYVNNVWSGVDLTSGAVTPMAPFVPGDSARLGAVRIGYGSDGYGREVWISDGSAAGTRRLHDVRADNPDGVSTSPRKVSMTAGDTLYFMAREYFQPQTSNYRSGLWHTHGTAATTAPLPRSLYNELSASTPYPLGDDLFFATSGGLNDPMSFFRLESDLGATSLLWGLPSATTVYVSETGDGQAIVFGCAYQRLCGIRHGDSQVTTLATGPSVHLPIPIGAIGNVAIFRTATDEVWRSDGTIMGTFSLASAREYRWLNFNNSVAMGGKLYFVTCTPGDAQDCQLTVTDGSVAGTGFVAPLSMGVITGAASIGQRIVFALVQNDNGGRVNQFWSSDGTAAGTQLLASGTGYLVQPKVVAAGGMVHMGPVCESCASPQLVSDGSAAGTYPLQLPAPYTPGSGFLAAIQGAVVFYCHSPASGRELCATDPSGSTVVALPDIASGAADADVALLGQTAGSLFLGADDGIHGRELWRLRLLSDAIFSDGFQAGNSPH